MTIEEIRQEIDRFTKNNRCTISQGLPYDPVLHGECGAIFDRLSLIQWQSNHQQAHSDKCPCCRQAIDFHSLVSDTQRAVDTMQFSKRLFTMVSELASGEETIPEDILSTCSDLLQPPEFLMSTYISNWNLLAQLNYALRWHHFFQFAGSIPINIVEIFSSDSKLIPFFELIGQLRDQIRLLSPDKAQELNSILCTLILRQNTLGHRIIWDAVEHDKISTLKWFSQDQAISRVLHVLQSPEEANIAHLAAAKGNIKILDWLRTCEWATALLTALDSSQRPLR